MSGSCPVWLSERRLTAHALSPLPIWLWAIDASRIIWANATGAATFGANTPNALATRIFDAGQPAAAQILRLAATLPPHEATRLERLRGFGAGVGRALTCNCAIVALADGRPAVLIAATERAGPDLTLNERARRLLAGCEEPVAVFGADGTFIDATAAAREKLGGAKTLAEIEARECVTSDSGTVAIFGVSRASETAIVPPSAPAEPPYVEPKKPEPEPPPAPTAAQSTAERRHPLRFVWQIDAQGKFTLDSEDFLALTGSRTGALMGQTWDTLASVLALDPDGNVGRALATRDTFSGLSVAWPIGGERLAVELSGLPVFDRERSFRGYRGFGVCRDVARLNALA